VVRIPFLAYKYSLYKVTEYDGHEMLEINEPALALLSVVLRNKLPVPDF
jgi:hypothetical protein